jgi:hypothetical protein
MPQNRILFISLKKISYKTPTWLHLKSYLCDSYQ